MPLRHLHFLIFLSQNIGTQQEYLKRKKVVRIFGAASTIVRDAVAQNRMMERLGRTEMRKLMKRIVAGSKSPRN
jgi:hypothetical protein